MGQVAGETTRGPAKNRLPGAEVSVYEAQFDFGAFVHSQSVYHKIPQTLRVFRHLSI